MSSWLIAIIRAKWGNSLPLDQRYDMVQDAIFKCLTTDVPAELEQDPTRWARRVAVNAMIDSKRRFDTRRNRERLCLEDVQNHDRYAYDGDVGYINLRVSVEGADIYHLLEEIEANGKLPRDRQYFWNCKRIKRFRDRSGTLRE